jgi:DivIVA domain-containing protein
MTTTQDQAGGEVERRLTPADVRNVRFTPGTRRNPGFDEAEVSRVLNRLAEELGRLIAEKAELRDQVNALREQLSDVKVPEPPSEQAVRILATAQQTADNYVAEAEEFSRQMTSDARAQYEERLREARENAGAIIQAAQEAAARMVAEGVPTGTPVGQGGPSPEQLEEQVTYLKAFGQAVRVQLKSYLEALLADVEAEWGRADPSALHALTERPEVPRPGATGRQALPAPNVAADVPKHGGSGPTPADGEGANGGAKVLGARR